MQPGGFTFADAIQAKKLVKELYPNARKLEVIDRGYDNIVITVDDVYAVRFPRNENALARSQYERQILRRLENQFAIEVPRVLGAHTDPPYLITSFVRGTHVSSREINMFTPALQTEFGKTVAQFAYTMHTALSLTKAKRMRQEWGLDELLEEPWDTYFHKHLYVQTFPTIEQDQIAKGYYANWQKLEATKHKLVVLHDDLHTENMLFNSSHLCGVLDFGDTNIGSPEQELRQLYRINEHVLAAAVTEYSRLSGSALDIEVSKTWAIVQELAVYAEKVDNDTHHHAFMRACRNLNHWIGRGAWGKGIISDYQFMNASIQ